MMPRPRNFKITNITVENKAAKPHRKETIPKALREQVWKRYIGDKYDSKCVISWCTNRISAFDFHVGHDVPESKGGTLEISNLRPICSRCNLSMGSKYSIKEWDELGGQKRGWRRYFCFL